MLHIIRVIALSIVALVSLYACGGESSGESSGSGVTSSSEPTVSSGDPIVLSGAAFYATTSFSCVGCHGATGAGGIAPQPINIHAPDPNGCASCTDVDSLALEIANTMPQGNTAACVGSTPGTCAYDIATFMMQEWITPNTPAPATPDVIVTAPINVATSETGNTATISLRLNTQPSSDVNISLSSSDITEGSINPGNLITLTFNAGNWNVDQDVVITGQDDGDIDGAVQYTIITDAVVTADTDYMGINPDDVIVTNTDDEIFVPAGITVTPTSGLSTSENTTAASFTVVLDTMPTQDVTIGLTSSNTNEGTVSPSSLTFTSLDYNTKTVTVTGVDDGVQDGSQTYMVVTAPAVSLDPAYTGLDASDVSVTNLDNEAGNPAINVSPLMGLITTEAGGTAQFNVVLASMPNANVTIAITSDDTTEGDVNLSSLTFTPADWDTAQPVTVTGTDDLDIDLNQAYNISLVISSTDPAYTGLAAITVSATNQDNEENLFASGKVAYENVIGGNSCASCPKPSDP